MATKETNRQDLLKIVVGLDFSEMSDRALRVALNLASNSAAAEVHLVHAVAPPVASAELAPIVDVRQAAESARQTLTGIVDKLAGMTNIRCVVHVLMGDPQRELPRIAEETAADLIVIGTHGRRGLDRALFGSVAEHVVRKAPCSVLTVRPSATSAEALIEPPCAECVATATRTGGKEKGCAQHSHHWMRPHTYSELPPSFGIGSMTFRF
jgi:nucleotide-binding universal stress UspA family protein